MAPKRKSDANDGRSAKVAKKNVAPPGWNWKATNPGWSSIPPSGPYGKACVEKYCLLAPFDPSITEAHWKEYSDERSALDTYNTTNGAEDHFECSNLSDNANFAFEKLSTASSILAREIMGTTLDTTEKTLLSRTLRGSLYLLHVEGEDDGNGSPRTVKTTLRLYGPHGLGRSLTLKYHYHNRVTEYSWGHIVSLVAYPRKIAQGSAGTQQEGGKKEADKIEIMTSYANQRKDGEIITKGTTLAKLKELELVLIGRAGVMSQSKLVDLFIGAGTVDLWDEDDIDQDLEALRVKYKLHAGETDGEKEVEEDEAEVEDDVPEYGDDESVECIPQNLLELARNGSS
ncbi:hypothetical protein P7C70_g3494, partial [Phenoliferia sp. Uapishka_3]